jgi:hypothetical protein
VERLGRTYRNATEPSNKKRRYIANNERRYAAQSSIAHRDYGVGEVNRCIGVHDTLLQRGCCDNGAHSEQDDS